LACRGEVFWRTLSKRGEWWGGGVFLKKGVHVLLWRGADESFPVLKVIVAPEKGT